MKVAIAVWEDHVSSVLDFSQQLVVVELKDGGETSRVQVALLQRDPFAKLTRLRELGINALICGAVSQPMASAVTACGIRLFPYVTGAVNEILIAYQAGQLGQPQFVLPGGWPGSRGAICRGRRRRCGRRGTGRQTNDLGMNGRDVADGDGV